MSPANTATVVSSDVILNPPFTLPVYGSNRQLKASFLADFFVLSLAVRFADPRHPPVTFVPERNPLTSSAGYAESRTYMSIGVMNRACPFGDRRRPLEEIVVN